MLKRIISSIIGLPVLIWLVATGDNILKAGILVASLIGMREFYHAFSQNEDKPIHFIGYAFACFYVFFIEQIINVSNYFNIFTSVFIVVMLIYTVVFHSKTNIIEAVITYFGYFYVCFLISHIFLVRDYTYGVYFVWLIFICAWGCDTGAYFTGVAIGKHKLIPSLSPKKTIEGAVGGIVAATLLGFLYSMAINKVFPLNGVNTTQLCVITAIIGSILSQIGDLAASAIKRYTKIKDFGKLIPGHGGIIDRFDSVLFTAPAVYYIMFFLISVS